VIRNQLYILNSALFVFEVLSTVDLYLYVLFKWLLAHQNKVLFVNIS